MKKYLEIYKKINKYLNDYKGLRLFVFILSLVLIVVYNLIALGVGNIVDQAVSQGNIQRAMLYTVLVIAAPLLLEPIHFFLRDLMNTRGVTNVSVEIYSKIMMMDRYFHTQKSTGDLVSRTRRMKDVITTVIWNFEWWTLQNILTNFLPIMFLWFLDYRLSIIALMSVLITLPLQYYALKVNLRTRKDSKISEDQYTVQIVDTITNHDTVRIFGNIQKEIEHFAQYMRAFEKTERRHGLSYRLVDFSARFSGLVVFGTTGYYALHLWQTGVLTIGDLTVVLTYLMYFVQGTISMFFSIRAVVANLPLFDDFDQLVSLEPELENGKQTYDSSQVKGNIKFEDVTFAYKDSQERVVLSGIDMDIKANSSVAFVGPSGGGKSTLVKLLMGHYQVSSGNILIDGINLDTMTKEFIADIIGTVPQEPIMFNRSIGYNIGYAIGADESILQDNYEKIVLAAKSARIHNFIESLPQKYDTIVGERGIKLSGGQRQRVAIARVFLKQPKIVVFDEATSMLDSESELEIKKAFSELSRNSTTIIIAHRLSTIVNCDTIFVIDEGRVVEKGTHNELVSLGGLYFRLWKIQSEGFKKGK